MNEPNDWNGPGPGPEAELSEELTAMLNRRAGRDPAVPDLGRVMADATRTPAGAQPMTASRGAYVLGMAAVFLVVIGGAAFMLRSMTGTINPAGNPAGGSTPVPAPIQADESDRTTTTTVPALDVEGTIVDGDDPATTETTGDGDGDGTTVASDTGSSTTTPSTTGTGPTTTEPPSTTGTRPTTSAPPSTGTATTDLVPTTLGCDGPGPTNQDCEPGTIYTECFSNQSPTTICCTPGTTTICIGGAPVDEPTPVTPTQPTPTVTLGPNDCNQVTTVPGCQSVPGPVESVTITTEGPDD